MVDSYNKPCNALSSIIHAVQKQMLATANSADFVRAKQCSEVITKRI